MDDAAFAAVLEVIRDEPQVGSWVTEAACRGQGETFTTYPRTRAEASLLERTCAGCPVRAACLAYSRSVEVEGVWAGEWHSWGRGTRPLLPAPVERPVRVSTVACGTPSGYRKHQRAGEVACEPCRAANAAAARARRAAAAA